MNPPYYRPRRLRINETVRAMVRETRLSPLNLIYPLFVCPGEQIKKEIGSMPGNYNLSVDFILEECRILKSLGIPAIMLFGLPLPRTSWAAGHMPMTALCNRPCGPSNRPFRRCS